jgi:hypothetical protein
LKVFYSTQPFLAWCLNHYFYDKLHYVYVAAPFYPHRLTNPRSSSPMRNYEDYYEAWKDNDKYNSFIAGKRIGLRAGVDAIFNNKIVNVQKDIQTARNQDIAKALELQQTQVKYESMRDDLLDICDYINLLFFYPILYRLDINQKSLDNRKVLKNSGLVKICGRESNEFLIKALNANSPNWDTYDILFTDFEVEIEQFELILSNAAIKDIDEVKRAREAKILTDDLAKLWDEKDQLTGDQVLGILKGYKN